MTKKLKLIAIDFERLTNLVLVVLYDHYMNSEAEYLESVRRIYDVWLSLTIRCNMMRIIARMTKAACDRLRFSKSFANLRQRPNQPNVRSTIQRLGKTVKPFAVSERLTISSGILASARTATAVAAP